MKVLNSKIAAAVVAVALTAIGVAGIGLLLSGESVQAAPPSGAVSQSDAYRFADGTAVDGVTSTLVRASDSITATFNTGDLESKNVYTMWWVIFNNPEECVAPIPGLSQCGEADVFGEPFGDTPVKVSVQFAAGNIVGGTGTASFGAHLDEGELPSGDGQVVFGSGLIDAKKAEVHLVVRTHGKAIPPLGMAQITTFGGACTAETDPTGVGPTGPNECADVQFAAHQP